MKKSRNLSVENIKLISSGMPIPMMDECINVPKGDSSDEEELNQ